MKRLAVLLLAVLVLSGCDFSYDPWEHYEDVTFYNIPFMEFTSVQEVMTWTAVYVMYRSDNGHYFQSPAETYDLQTGDCEDFTALAMYMLKTELGLNSNMVNGFKESVGHAWVEVNGEWWEPQTAGRCESYVLVYPEIEYWSYAKTMWRAVSIKRSVM